MEKALQALGHLSDQGKVISDLKRATLVKLEKHRKDQMEQLPVP